MSQPSKNRDLIKNQERLTSLLNLDSTKLFKPDGYTKGELLQAVDLASSLKWVRCSPLRDTQMIREIFNMTSSGKLVEIEVHSLKGKPKKTKKEWDKSGSQPTGAWAKFELDKNWSPYKK